MANPTDCGAKAPTTSCSLAATATAGNTLIVYVGDSAATNDCANISFADNNAVNIPQKACVGINTKTTAIYSYVVVGAPTAVTYTNSSGTTGQIEIAELAGASGATLQTATTSSATATSISTTGFGSTVSAGGFIACGGTGTTITLTSSAGALTAIGASANGKFAYNLNGSSVGGATCTLSQASNPATLVAMGLSQAGGSANGSGSAPWIGAFIFRELLYAT